MVLLKNSGLMNQNSQIYSLKSVPVTTMLILTTTLFMQQMFFRQLTSLLSEGVLDSTSFVISSFNYFRLLNDVEVLASLVAAAGHDINHPGYNNVFMINSRSPLAILYNDQSVLYFNFR
jgi:hypothetical protein